MLNGAAVERRGERERERESGGGMIVIHTCMLLYSGIAKFEFM